MMAPILNSAIFDTSILQKKNSDSNLFNSTLTHSFWLNLMMAAILNSAILNLTILDSATLVFPLKLTHTCQDWFPPFAQKKPSLTLPSPPFAPKKLHSFILTQLDDGSHLEFYHVGLKNFTNSFWLNLMMAAILNSAILNSTISDIAILVFPLKSHSHLPRLVPTICTKKPSLIHSDSTWWWQPSWILPCWIQTLPCWIQTPSYLLSDSLKNTLPPLWLLTQTNSIWLKLIHSHSTWWWQPSWILPSWIPPYQI